MPRSHARIASPAAAPLLALLLTACSTVPSERAANTPAAAPVPSARTAVAQAARPATAATAASGAVAQTQEHDAGQRAAAQERAERPLPEESVLPLLQAEFALRQRDYDTALALYMEQARLLRDPAVSAHTTHLAQFMQREAEALEAVRLWVELQPRNVEANATLATLLVRGGELLAAVDHLALVAGEQGEARFPILLNGFEGLEPEARRTLQERLAALQDTLPESIPLLLTRALMAEADNDKPAVRARLDEVFLLDPFQQQALLLEARERLAAGEDAPYSRIEAALEDDPERDELRLQYARMLARSDLPAAREQFRLLAERNPRDGDLLLSLALVNEELGDLDRARAHLQEVLKLQQRTNDAYFMLGRIAEAEGEFGEAIQHYMQVGGGEEFLPATLRIGRLLLDAGQQARFDGYFDTLRATFSDRSEALFNLQASLLIERGENAPALALLNEGIAAFPESANLLYNRSVVHERSDAIDAAEQDLRAILASDPGNATALNALGYTLTNRTERHNEALELIERALALDPDDPAVLDSMGWVLFKLGELERALGYLREAYAAFPDPEVAAHLGEALWSAGEQEQARTI
jgi:tetratricopeptide (TPR) repeat protein